MSTNYPGNIDNYSVKIDGVDTVALADDNGDVTDRYEYSAFGNLQSHTGSDSNRIMFSSEPNDEDSGLIYLRHRYYEPESGRFVSRDPDYKMNKNLYAYCKNNPVGWIDPSGAIDIFIGYYGGSGPLITDFNAIKNKYSNHNIVIKFEPNEDDVVSATYNYDFVFLSGHGNKQGIFGGQNPGQLRITAQGINNAYTKHCYKKKTTRAKFIALMGCYTKGSGWEKVFNGNFAPGFIGRSSTTITTLNDNIIESFLYNYLDNNSTKNKLGVSFMQSDFYVRGYEYSR